MARIAVVVPRYGDEVVGGAERFAQDVATTLAAAGHDIEVITTTALDYESWAPHYPAGVSRSSAGLTIRRFDNMRPRWASVRGRGDPFAAYGVPIPSPFIADIHRNKQEKELEALANTPLHQSAGFIEEQGPFSDEMFAYLLANHAVWDRVFFVPYLYPTTLVGSRMIPADRVIIMLAAHNETLIHFPIFREYRRYRWGVFYEGEREMFARAVGGPPERGHGVVTPHPSVSHPRPPGAQHRNSLVFVGRVCGGKCVDRLIDLMEKAALLLEGPLKGQSIKLELVGTVEDHLRPMVNSRDWIVKHGNVSMARRDEIVSECMALVSPSLLDSMGLVNLEAAFVGTPVLVNTDCPAFLDLVELSHRAVLGFSIYDPLSLARAIDMLSVRKTRRDVAHRLHTWAIERFTSAAFLDSLLKLLRL